MRLQFDFIEHHVNLLLIAKLLFRKLGSLSELIMRGVPRFVYEYLMGKEQEYTIL